MKIKDLKNKVEKAIYENEYNLVKIKGVNLSRADLETISMYCDILEQKGNLNGYMVFGEVKEVFDKFGIDY